MIIENALILDTETTGLHVKNGAEIIELGAILYSIKHKAILQCFSTLFPCESNPVEHINHISPELTKAYPYNDKWESFFAYMYQDAQVLISHNTQFDKLFLETLDYGVSHGDIPWICTKNDFKWPNPLNRYRLQDICHSMGVIYGEGSHRALYDCSLIEQCLSKVEDLQERMDAAYEKSTKK
jgi:DNA polymerase-3 subunit epsilon